jgi:hypothetical protein
MTVFFSSAVQNTSSKFSTEMHRFELCSQCLCTNIPGTNTVFLVEEKKTVIPQMRVLAHQLKAYGGDAHAHADFIPSDFTHLATAISAHVRCTLHRMLTLQAVFSSPNGLTKNDNFGPSCKSECASIPSLTLTPSIIIWMRVIIQVPGGVIAGTD